VQYSQVADHCCRSCTALKAFILSQTPEVMAQKQRVIQNDLVSLFSRLPTPEPALVSAGPWQGLDATASAERKHIRGSGAVPAAGVQGTQPPVEGQGALQSWP